MTITAQRFNVLDQQTNIATTDFASINHSGILNDPALNNLGLDANTLNSLKGILGNNLLPDLSILMSFLSGYNNQGSQYANNSLGIGDLLTLLLSSPAFRNLLGNSNKSELTAMVPSLLKQLTSNNTTAYSSLNKSIISKSTVNALNLIKAEQSTTNNALTTYTNKTVINAPIVTKQGLVIANNNQLTAIQSNAVVSSLLPTKSATIDAIKVLPTDIKQKTLNDLNVSTNAAYTLINNIPTPVLNTTGEVGAFIDASSKLTNSNWTPVIVNPDQTTNTLTTLTNTVTSMGLPPAFSEFSKTFTDPVSIAKAGQIILTKAATAGDLATIVDITLNSNVRLINALSANGINTIIDNLKIPVGASVNDLINLYNLLVTALTALDPNWSSTNYTLPSGAVASYFSTAKFNNISSVIPPDHITPDMVKWLNVYPNISLDMWRLITAKAFSTPLVIPDFTTNPGAIISTVINPDQWMLCAIAFIGDTVPISIKKYFPGLPVLLVSSVTQTVINSPINITTPEYKGNVVTSEYLQVITTYGVNDINSAAYKVPAVTTALQYNNTFIPSVIPVDMSPYATVLSRYGINSLVNTTFIIPTTINKLNINF